MRTYLGGGGGKKNFPCKLDPKERRKNTDKRRPHGKLKGKCVMDRSTQLGIGQGVKLLGSYDGVTLFELKGGKNRRNWGR